MDLPARIGRYEIVRLLGQGGMGRVLLANDPVLGRRVAIKVLRDDLALAPQTKEALFARMRQEARAAAALEHPHMVTLHDMGEEAPHGLFLVFEFVDGPTLRDVITERGAMRLPEVARMARELGAALSAAHEAKVIHRDVKPENVMLSRWGAKLTDFGIARLPDSTLTSAGSVLGTPSYSAPEALAQAEFSPESDQFSLAVTLYEAIGGRRAYPGDDALTVATRVTTEPPPALPLSSATHSSVVARMDRVLQRAMSKDPKQRFASCKELGEALAIAIEAPIVPTPLPMMETPPPLSIVPRATRRLQNFIAAGALILIVTLLLLGRHGAESGASLRQVATSFASVIQPTYGPAPVLPPPPPPRHHPTAARNDASAGDDAGREEEDAAAEHDALDATAAARDARDAHDGREPRDADTGD